MEKMIWKITYLLAFLKVLIKASPRPVLQFPSEEYLEELYDKRIVKLFNSMPTLVERDVTFDENDSALLSNDCYPDENRLRDKKVSVKKYQEKMQAIQCIHGLFVLNVLDVLEDIYEKASGDIFELKLFLKKPVLNFLQYMTNMLSLLNMAKWDAHDWQVEIFTYLAGLFAVLDCSDDNVKVYEVRFGEHKERVRAKVFPFVSQCLQQEYLTYRGNNTSEASKISALVGCAVVHVVLWHSRRVLNAYQYEEYYTVQNLMLQQLYSSEKVVLNWSKYGFQLELETGNVQKQLNIYTNEYGQQYLNHRWELDPIGGNKYNALILKCIYLRLMFFAWVHLRTYHVLRIRSPSADLNAPLVKIWKMLVGHLTRALRVFGFKENTYWSAIHVMRDDYKYISNDQLEAREKFTRSYLCRTAEDLGLASESDVDRRLQEIEIPEEHDSMYKSIETNAETLNSYTFAVLFALIPVDGTFIRILVSAEGNETFVWR